MTPSNVSKSNPYDKIAPQYDCVFLEANEYYNTITLCEWEMFKSKVSPAHGHMKALDIGCGTGLHTEWLTSLGYLTTALDKSTEMIKIAANKTRGHAIVPNFVVGDILAEPLGRTDLYDVICCLGSTLNHLNDWGAFAQIIGRHLNPEGIFIFSFDNLSGIDTLSRWLLRERAGYSRYFMRDVIFKRADAIVKGAQFQNHWVPLGAENGVEVELYYEKTQRWVEFMSRAGLRGFSFQGVHLVDCWNRVSLRASAGILPTTEPRGCNSLSRHLGSLLGRLDRIAGRIAYHIAANIVGSATRG